MNALLRWSQANPLDEEVAYALSQGWGTQIPDPEFAKARRARQNLALRGYDTYQEPQSVNALSPIVSGSDQASFLRSEKDTRPYYETDQRGMVAPLVKSGYNDSVALANPVVTGGSAPSILNDILQGRQVDKGEIQQAAGDAAGAAMTGSLALSRPSGSIGSGGRPEAPGIRAYHGSPHDFDRFDLSKIGTGEGAQAFGHGLYFAESKGTADFYRQKLSSDGGDRISRSSPTYMADTANEVGKGDQAAALAWLQSEIRKLGSATTPVTAERRNAALEAVKLIEEGRKPMPPNGRMYEVNIKADPNDFLDWDKPLSQQSEKVRGAIAATQPSHLNLLDAVEPYSTRDALERIGTSRLKEGQPSHTMMDEARQALREAGIPGIKYLDQGSRTAGDGSRNYVVFDDALVEILRKYGLAGLGVLGASGLGTQDAQAEPLRASDNVISEPFYNALLGVQAMGNGYQPGPVQSDYVIDRRNEDPEGVYQSDRVGFRRRVPSADTMPPELRFLLPRP